VSHALLLSLLTCPIGVTSASAQLPSSASVVGRLLRADDSAPLAGARIELRSRADGSRYEAESDELGRFLLPAVPPGGPYEVSARAIGYVPTAIGDRTLAVGERLVIDLRLSERVLELPELSATASDPSTPTAYAIPERYLRELPILTRNFVEVLQVAPTVVDASIAGQNNRYNNIQVDGQVANDLYGLSGGGNNPAGAALPGTPGGRVNARPVPLDAVAQLTVDVAPFDVRLGQFTGGLVNAITRSGTNALEGSLFAFFQDDALVGRDSSGTEAGEFSVWQFGGTLAGPVVRDRLHALGSVELQRRATPYAGPTIPTGNCDVNPDNGVGISCASAERFASILNDRYGVDAGEFGEFTVENPVGNLLLKVSGQPTAGGYADLSYSYARGADDVLTRQQNGDYGLTSNGYTLRSTTHTLRGTWSLPIGRRWANQVLAGYSAIVDEQAPESGFPTVIATADQGRLVAGADRNSQENQLDQHILQLAENVTGHLGDHEVQGGVQLGLLSFRDAFFPQSLGQWTFASLDALEAGTPSRFDRALPLRPEGTLSDFGVTELAFYLQDVWRLHPRFSATFGVRVDVPIVGTSPTFNPAVLDAFGVRTDEVPSGNALWSPRLGLRWDAGANRRTTVHGGLGWFTGRIPYVWLSNAYRSTGLEQAQLTCTGPAVPAFTLDPAAQPTTCGNGAGPAPPATPFVAFFDPGFDMPRLFRVAAGVSQQLGAGTVVSVDGVYSLSSSQLYLNDANLVGVQGVAAGEGGRPLYGSVNPANGNASPVRVDAGFAQAIEYGNSRSEQAMLLSAQVRQALGPVALEASYTYSRSEDRLSSVRSQPRQMLGFAPLDGTLEDRTLTRSFFDRPHKVVLTAAARLPLGIQAALVYIGVSGGPFTYTVNGDANADGFGGGGQRGNNDAIYVPRDPADVSLVTSTGAPAAPEAYDDLEEFIEDQACLERQRGRLLERNSCRDPWQNFLNLRADKTFVVARRHALGVMVDIFNLLNLLNGDWGLVRQTTTFEGVEALRLRGYDAAAGRGRYELTLPRPAAIVDDRSRWRIQLGLRYGFTGR
jgi:hypothetical protein